MDIRAEDLKYVFTKKTEQSCLSHEVPKDEAAVSRISALSEKIDPLLPVSTGSLNGRVTKEEISLESTRKAELEKAISEDDAILLDQLEEMGFVPEYTEILKKELAEDPPEVNYMIRLRNVVAQMLAQLHKIGEKDKDLIKTLKADFKKYSQSGADLQRNSGWNGLGFAIGSLIISTVGMSGVFASKVDNEFVGMIGKDLVPQIGKLFDSKNAASQQEANAGATVASTEWNAKTSKGQADSTSKQEVIGLLDKSEEVRKQAARAG